MHYNPSIILKCLSTQATYITKKYGQMFYFTDYGQVYVDTQNKGRILASDIYVLQYERERNNYIPNNKSTMATEPDALTPDQQLLNYIYVYVVETNCLYTYQYSSKTWQTIYGKYGMTTVAQTYNPEGEAVIVNADDVTTNGILNDGSVVIRDGNKMICGLAKSDGYTLIIQSLIGGQINLEPSSTAQGRGCLQLNSENYDTNLNNNLIVFGDIKTTNKENWLKQYRLVTQDVQIISHTVVKTGSTVKAGSILGSTKYDVDTKLPSDITTETGLIITGSKLYINSVVNNETLKPPYLFDLDNGDIQITPKVFTVTTGCSILDNTLNIDINCPFVNIGDSCFVSFDNTETISKVKFKDKEFDIEYQAKEGLSSSMHIVYSFKEKVKLLP